MSQRIAIVGGGIAGLTAAWYLSRDHQVTLFEAEPCPGGHTFTLDVQREHGDYAVDMGFIVVNDRTYPSFEALLAELGSMPLADVLSLLASRVRYLVPIVVLVVSSFYLRRTPAVYLLDFSLFKAPASWNATHEEIEGMMKNAGDGEESFNEADVAFIL